MAPGKWAGVSISFTRVNNKVVSEKDTASLDRSGIRQYKMSGDLTTLYSHLYS